MAMTPLMVDLAEKSVVIIGGGHVAERRVNTLLESGASITIISPEISEKIRSLWETGLLNWQQKDFETEDLAEAFLVIAATDNPDVNQAAAKATPPNSLLNAAADADQGDVHFPSYFKQGKLSIGISTNGASPMLSAKIKRQLQLTYNSDYGNYVDFLCEVRQLINHSTLVKTEQKSILREVLSEDFLNNSKQRQMIERLSERSTMK
ncbi:potassium transporter Trk [Virgibacillus phasianinus]|uniref:precorrin-2 dehydrogenase n=1 Tax=Virgibacillus phasianinus TaxID=2017483 RepID=A0A220U233_9BACI|nr:NAD(P)-binding protein [Virgibacillus phasianinus]ASK62179.1 potassium transporter Trk [Virgibacillus phasianinus]